MKLHPFALCLVFGVASLWGRVAHADSCATLSFPGDKGQDVILGEYSTTVWHPLYGERLIRWGELGVCWYDEDQGSWSLERLHTCDTSTPGADVLLLQTWGGDDTVTTLYGSSTGPNWIEGAMRCSADGRAALAPWNSDFDFGVHAVLGTGFDRFYGTPGDDIAESNAITTETVNIPHPWGPPTFVQVAPGDGASDILCGGEGDDELLGDADDGPTFEEILDGGEGDDFCDGDPLNWPDLAGGGSIFDIAQHVFGIDYGCNTIENATTPAIYTFLDEPWLTCLPLASPIYTFGL